MRRILWPLFIVFIFVGPIYFNFQFEWTIAVFSVLIVVFLILKFMFPDKGPHNSDKSRLKP